MGEDEQLVARWQGRRDRQALDELRRRLRPLVQSQVNKYRSNAVPTALIESEADRILVSSADSFKPRAGASFRTHVFTNLRRLNRFSVARANIASIPEARAQSIGTFTRVYDLLSDTKGRPPTTSELADELSWNQKAVLTMQRSLRRDIISSGVQAPMAMDLYPDKQRRLMEEIWFELTPDEQRVFTLLTGRGGVRKIVKGQDVARATGFSQAKVSQLRTSIASKMERFL